MPVRGSFRSSALAGLWAAVLVPPLWPQQCDIQYVGGDPSGLTALGGFEPSLSANGQRVAYLQHTGLTYHAFLHDLKSGHKQQIDTLSDGLTMDGGAFLLTLSADGNHAAFMSSSQNAGALGGHVYHKDLTTGTLRLATVKPDGTPIPQTGNTIAMGHASISGAGNLVAFTSDSPLLVPGKTSPWRDVFVRDVFAGTTVRVLGQAGVEPNLPALFEPALSMDGRFVAFASRASNLVPGDTNGRDDVFVYDLASAAVERVSLSITQTSANHDSEDPVISADGRFVAFLSRATNLVIGDSNGFHDVFVRDRLTKRTLRANLGPGGQQANQTALGVPRLSAGGEFVVFHSTATNLLETPTQGGRLFLRNVREGVTTQLVGHVASPGENNVCGLSADALTFAFGSVMPFGPSDTNNFFDVFALRCAPSVPVVYCPVTKSSLGCPGALEFEGTPSAQGGAAFVIRTTQSTSQQLGLLLYSTSGSELLPLGSSFHCLAAPVGNVGLQNSGGNASPLDCSGALLVDFNAHIASQVDASLVLGAPVWAQYWSRDPAAPSAGHRSNALHFSIGP